ncbi:MAG: ABC transporter substrate binding protein, partial [Nanoarchaeota archaeon]
VREPGNNITGVRYPGTDLAIQRLSLLLEIAPETKRVFIPYQKNYPIVPPQFEVIQSIADERGVVLLEVPFDTTAELKTYLDEPKNNNFDAILLIPEPLTTKPDAFLILDKVAEARKIPLGGRAPGNLADTHCLFNISPDNVMTGKQAAVMADKIFRGVSAGTIPVVSPNSVIEVNNKAAEKLGFQLSQSVLSRANAVVR